MSVPVCCCTGVHMALPLPNAQLLLLLLPLHPRDFPRRSRALRRLSCPSPSKLRR